MRLLDRTPFRGEDGQINLIDKARATMKYGTSWLTDLEAQDKVVAIFKKTFDQRFVLLRNYLLPGTEVMVPLILVGPPGVFLFFVTNLRGVYRAKGDEWGIVEDDRYVPASVNLIGRTAKLAAGLQKFLERQGLSVKVEGALLAASAGLQVESVRPAVKVVMSDGLERFAFGLMQASSILSPEMVVTITNRIENPAPPKRTGELAAPPPTAAPEPEEAPMRKTASGVPVYVPPGFEYKYDSEQGEEPQEEQATFGGSSSWDARLGFGESQAQASSSQRMADGESAASDSVFERPAPEPESPARPTPKAAARPTARKPKVQKYGPFSLQQWIVLSVILVFWLCVMGGFLFFILRQ